MTCHGVYFHSVVVSRHVTALMSVCSALFHFHLSQLLSSHFIRSHQAVSHFSCLPAPCEDNRFHKNFSESHLIKRFQKNAWQVLLYKGDSFPRIEFITPYLSIADTSYTLYMGFILLMHRFWMYDWSRSLASFFPLLPVFVLSLVKWLLPLVTQLQYKHESVTDLVIEL